MSLAPYHTASIDRASRKQKQNNEQLLTPNPKREREGMMTN